MAERYFESSRESDLEYHILRLYSKLRGFSAYDARLSYLDYVNSWPIYGATFFNVEPEDASKLNSKQVIMAINRQGVLLIHPETQEFLANYDFRYSILSWGFAESSFAIVTGVEQNSVKLFFKTDQGKYMNELFDVYVKEIQDDEEDDSP